MSINRWQTTKLSEAFSIFRLVAEKMYFELGELNICRSSLHESAKTKKYLKKSHTSWRIDNQGTFSPNFIRIHQIYKPHKNETRVFSLLKFLKLITPHQSGCQHRSCRRNVAISGAKKEFMVNTDTDIVYCLSLHKGTQAVEWAGRQTSNPKSRVQLLP